MVAGLEVAIVLRSKRGPALLTQTYDAVGRTLQMLSYHSRCVLSCSGLAWVTRYELASIHICRRGVDIKAAVDASFEVAALLASHASGTKDDDG